MPGDDAGSGKNCVIIGVAVSAVVSAVQQHVGPSWYAVWHSGPRAHLPLHCTQEQHRVMRVLSRVACCKIQGPPAWS